MTGLADANVHALHLLHRHMDLLPQLKRPELVCEDWVTLVGRLRVKLGQLAVSDVHIREEV